MAMSESGGMPEFSPVDGEGKWSPLDTGKPHSARMYDYWLGGKDNFASDRQAADAVEELFPTIRIAARENRRFLRRAVTTLAAEHGIEQFLDIGTGLPAAGNTHEVAQTVARQARVVYVDNDPLVMSHARALLTSVDEQGMTAYIESDLRHPEIIIEKARRTLNFGQPIAL